MANEQNLRKLSTEEAREIGKKGGMKSAEVRRARKTLREELLALLGTNNYNEKMSLAMIDRALKGDTKAFEVIRDTIGEKPKDTLQVNQEKPFEVNIIVKKQK